MSNPAYFTKIARHHEFASRAISFRLAPKLKLLLEIVEHQSNLASSYTTLNLWQWRFGVGGRYNVVLSNALSNWLYACHATIPMLRMGYYGSAQPVVRQAFEMMLIAKLATVDKRYIDHWLARSEGDGVDQQISVSREIFGRFRRGRSNQELVSLRRIWKELSNAVHHTPMAQQAPLILSPNRWNGEEFDEQAPLDKLEAKAIAEVCYGSEYVTDALFLLAFMAQHLLSCQRRELYYYFIRYASHADDLSRIDVVSRKRVRELFSDFHAVNRSKAAWRQLWASAQLEFRSTWKDVIPGGPRKIFRTVPPEKRPEWQFAIADIRPSLHLPRTR